MKKIFCCLCLLPCLYLLKAGLPARLPKSHHTLAAVNPDNRSGISATGKVAYRAAFECAYTVLYVDSSRNASGDGGSWSTAYKELREALAAAAQCPNVNSILVAKGTYKPVSSTIPDSAFTILRGGLKLYGGYAPGGSGSRNVAGYPTILSGDIGKQNNASDNSYHVMVIAGLGSSADSVVVDGFTITGGNAKSIEVMSYHGISVMRNCGGGINLTGNSGAGEKIAVRSCVFISSRAFYGGGMYNINSSPTVTDCIFSTNQATTFGGGMYNTNSFPTVTDCIFSTNQATDNGGGMYNTNSSPTVTDCIFSTNQAGFRGGGMYNFSLSSPYVINCTFSANTASDGGGMMNLLSSPSTTNCTFFNNSAVNGGGISNRRSTPVVTNCIIWGNGDGILNNEGSAIVTYSDVEGMAVYPGTGNINADPHFVNADDPDGNDNRFATSDDGLRLQPGSPAINKGLNTALPAGTTTDITGALRIQQSIVDMGAYEFTPIYLSINDVTKAEGNSGTTNFSFTVRLSMPAPSGGIKFTIATADSTAAAPADYTARSVSASIAGGDSSYAFTVAVKGDRTVEPTEYFLVKVSNVTSPIVFVIDSTGLGTITNDDVTYLSINDVTKAEGNSGTTNFNFTVRLSAPAPSDGIKFTITTADSIAAAPTDYTARSVSASIAGGDSAYVFTVAVKGDRVVEPTEHFLVKVTNVSGLLLSVTDSTGTGTITNDDGCTAAVLYVDSSNRISGNGGSWATAYKELRDALTAGAQCPDLTTIYVAKGTYKSTDNTNRDSSFVILKGLKLYGGYPSGGGIRNIAANPTILSGDIGNRNDTSDNSYHVMIIAGLGSRTDSVVVDGFTVTKGNANGSGSRVYNGVSAGRNNGGGIALLNNDPGSKTVIRNCIFLANGSGVNLSGGGGMYNASSSPSVINCTFSANSGTLGGGMLNVSCSPLIINCVFSFNSAVYGGGIANSSASSMLTNCTFSSNRSTISGGGVWNFGSGSTPETITNCIFWGNTGPNPGIYTSGDTPTVAYSDVQGTGVYPGTGNINADPLFVNAADPDGADNTFGTADDGLRQLAVSPVINKGSNVAVPAGNTTDITGAPRIQQGIVDIGAYEIAPIYLSINDVAKPEGNSGSSTLTFTVRLSAPAPTGGIRFVIATADSTAVAPADYTARSVSASIAAGDSTYAFGVEVKGDLLIEPNEHFLAKISNVTSPVIFVTDSAGLGTITNDDKCGATVLYVDSSRSSSGDGSSWSMAYKELRDALAAASQCQNIAAIYVAKGTYKPTNNANRDSAFAILRGGLKLYGGYSSGGGVRNITANPTILSGDIGRQNDNADNSYHVMVIAGLGSTADSLVVDGFRITGGNAEGEEGKVYNGVSLSGSSGGGMYLGENSNAGKRIAVSNCVFSANLALTGGGMSSYFSSPAIVNCTFSGNYGGSSGGGMYNSASSPVINNCIFSSNNATIGGGMYSIAISGISVPVITSCIFTANTASVGGGMSNYLSSPIIINCVISGNSAYYNAGGILNTSSSPVITNCTFSANGTSAFGGAIFNTTVSSPVITNSIIWGNSTGIENDGSSAAAVSYSDVQGTNIYPGTANINISPRFVDSLDFDGPDNIFGTTDDGLSLKSASSAINKGRNGALPVRITTDITGAPRIQQGIVDIGAYESMYGAAVTAQQGQAATVQEEIPAAVSIYPNPVRDKFTVQLAGLKGTKGSIALIDLNGKILEQRVISLAVNTSMQTQVFNLSAQPPGTYFVQVKSEDGVRTLKVVVAR